MILHVPTVALSLRFGEESVSWFDIPLVKIDLLLLAASLASLLYS